RLEPFRGVHQAGITTPAQNHTYVAAFDLIARERDDLVGMLRAWTLAAERMSRGELAVPVGVEAPPGAIDNGETQGVSSSGLTLTFVFGTVFFSKDGEARYALLPRRPPALIDLPHFNGDELAEERPGGDLSVQACADEPQIAFNA